jgi:hypothetical protein
MALALALAIHIQKGGLYGEGWRFKDRPAAGGRSPTSNSSAWSTSLRDQTCRTSARRSGSRPKLAPSDVAHPRRRLVVRPRLSMVSSADKEQRGRPPSQRNGCYPDFQSVDPVTIHGTLEDMSRLRHPALDSDEELKLFAKEHPWNDDPEEVSEPDFSRLRSIVVGTAISQEAAYVPWFDQIANISTAGNTALQNGAMSVEGETDSFNAADLNEYAGWMALRQRNPKEASDLMTSLVMSKAPAVPAHWPFNSDTRNHRQGEPDKCFGNVYHSHSPLTALALATVLEKRSVQNLQIALFKASPSRDWFLYGIWPAIAKWAHIVGTPASLEPLVGIVLSRGAGSTSRAVQEDVNFISSVETLITQIESETNHLALLALKDQLHTLARGNISAIARALPWFVALHTRTHITLLTTLAMESSDVLTAARDCGKLEGEVAIRAKGLALSVDSGDSASPADTFMWWLDKKSYVSPQPLAAPTSTWLDDVVLEKEIRDRANACVERLINFGLSEETEVTGALVNELVNAFSSRNPLPQSRDTSPPLRVSITSTNSRTHENRSGADLGMVLKINLPGRQQIETGHLIQVKQATNRDSPDSVPNWQIDVVQLNLILTMDPTATYWLLQLHKVPKVFSVSAKVLLALANSRNNLAVLSVTYNHVRSSSVGLGTEIMDLLIGQWIGIATDEAVKLARGLDSRHAPAYLLELNLETTG